MKKSNLISQLEMRISLKNSSISKLIYTHFNTHTYLFVHIIKPTHESSEPNYI